jgi:hypothetical protein
MKTDVFHQSRSAFERLSQDIFFSKKGGKKKKKRRDSFIKLLESLIERSFSHAFGKEVAFTLNSSWLVF